MRKALVTVVFFEELTFHVRLSIAPADPDVGISEAYIEEWEIEQVEDCKDQVVRAFFADTINGTKRILDYWMDALTTQWSELEDEEEPYDPRSE